MRVRVSRFAAHDGNEFIFYSGHGLKKNARGNSKRPALGRETKKEKQQ
jgi:hypothetical protein